MTACLFCEKVEHVPPDNTDYICSACVIMLGDTSQETLKRALESAVACNAERKATAIRSFIQPDIIEPVNKRRKVVPKDKPARRFERTGPKRFSRPMSLAEVEFR